MLKNILNMFKMGSQSLEDFELEQKIKKVTSDDLIHTYTLNNVKLKAKKDEDNEMENELTNEENISVENIVSDTVATEEENTVEETVVEENQTEITEEVQNEIEETGSEDVSEDTEENEPVGEVVVPSNEISEENEPSNLIHSVETEQLVQEEENNIVSEENEPSNEMIKDIPQNSIQVNIPSETNVVDDELERVKKELEQLRADNAKKEIELAKAELAKEVEQDFNGVPLSTNETVEFLYEIRNSALNEGTKDFIINSLKQLSKSNLVSCEEVGNQLKVEIDPKAELQKKVDEAKDKHGLTEGQALLYIKGKRTLNEAKQASKIVNKRKR